MGLRSPSGTSAVSGRFAASGWQVISIDGHDPAAIDAAKAGFDVTIIEKTASLGGYAAKLRKQLQGTGVSVTRNGDELVLNMPGNVTFDTDHEEIRPEFSTVASASGRLLELQISAGTRAAIDGALVERGGRRSRSASSDSIGNSNWIRD